MNGTGAAVAAGDIVVVVGGTITEEPRLGETTETVGVEEAVGKGDDVDSVSGCSAEAETEDCFFSWSCISISSEGETAGGRLVEELRLPTQMKVNVL